MISDTLFTNLPESLRQETLAEFQELSSNFLNGRWRASGLNAGRFCEIVYCILKGAINGNFPEYASKPADFRGSCKQLESETSLPRSFRFLIPQILTVLYEVRNNRNIGHVGGDVDPSFMDACFVIANVKWVLAELIRSFHAVNEVSAQSTVDLLSQYGAPHVWLDDKVRRVLMTKLAAEDKILLLLSSAGGRASRKDIYNWLEELAQSTYNRRILKMHEARLIEAKAYSGEIQILPAGSTRIAEIGVSS